MKFLLLALAVFGVAQTTVIQPNSLQEVLDHIKGYIPSDRIVEIVQSCSDDPEIQVIAQYLREELPDVVKVIHKDCGIYCFFAFLSSAGITFDWLNHLLGLWGIAPIKPGSYEPKTCDGWRGVYEQIQEEFQIFDLLIVISEAYDNFPEFTDLWDRISAAEETIQRLLDDPTVASVFVRLRGLGVDLVVAKDIINGLFGWQLNNLF